VIAAIDQRRRSLDARPVPNPGLAVREGADGCTVLVAPKELTRKPAWQKLVFLMPRERELSVELDRTGSFVWNLCDGERRVRDIILTFAERHQFARREAEVSVLSYLKTLGERGFIGMKMDQSDD